MSAAVFVFGACATGAGAGVDAADAGSGAAERFANTTDACPRAHAVRVRWARADSAWIRVAPGDELALTAPVGAAGADEPGDELIVFEDRDGGRELGRLPNPAGDGLARARYYGCAAPEHLAAGPGRAALRVAHVAHGCAPGLRGPVAVTLGGRAVAEVPPGEEATAFVPTGALIFDVATDGGAEGCSGGRVAATVADDGGDLAIGWSPRVHRAAGLAPLSVLGPAASCPDDVRREVRAGGIDVALGPGEAYTLYVPPGRHRVTVIDSTGGADEHSDRVARDVALEVGAEGGLVPARACDATAASPEESS